MSSGIALQNLRMPLKSWGLRSYQNNFVYSRDCMATEPQRTGFNIDTAEVQREQRSTAHYDSIVEYCR